MVGRVPSGGIVTVIALGAVRDELKASSDDPRRHGLDSITYHPDILTANTHFMKSTYPGKASVRVNILKCGKTTATVMATLAQDGHDCLVLLATCGNINSAKNRGPNLIGLSANVHSPVLPPLQECTHLEAGDNDGRSVRDRVVLMVPEAVALQFEDCRKTTSDPREAIELRRRREMATRTGQADYAGYCWFADNTKPSLTMAPAYLDAGIPPVFGIPHVTPSWVPTINWTVQFKAHPAKGPLKFRFKTSTVTGGFLEEDGELWDSEGNLVALSRQLALAGVPQKKKTTAQQLSKL